jgi:hypothetical protein
VRWERRRTTDPGAAAEPSCGVRGAGRLARGAVGVGCPSPSPVGQARGPGWRGAGIVLRPAARSLGTAAPASHGDFGTPPATSPPRALRARPRQPGRLRRSPPRPGRPGRGDIW